MAKVILSLESPILSAEDLEGYLESLRPALAMMTAAEVHVIVQEED